MAAELEVSERTIFRDLNVLELAGVPWFHNQEDQRYRVRPGYNFPALNLGDEELIGQATASVITSAPGLDVTRGRLRPRGSWERPRGIKRRNSWMMCKG